MTRPFKYSPYESSPSTSLRVLEAASHSSSSLASSSSSFCSTTTSSTFGDHQPPPQAPNSFSSFKFPHHDPENFFFQDGDVEIHFNGREGGRVFRVHRYKTLDRSSSRLFGRRRGEEKGGVQVVKIEGGDKVLCWEVLLSALYDEDSFISQPNLSLFHVYALLHLSEKYQFREMHRLAAGLFDDLCDLPGFGVGEM